MKIHVSITLMRISKQALGVPTIEIPWIGTQHTSTVKVHVICLQFPACGSLSCPPEDRCISKHRSINRTPQQHAGFVLEEFRLYYLQDMLTQRSKQQKVNSEKIDKLVLLSSPAIDYLQDIAAPVDGFYHCSQQSPGHLMGIP